jgi:hypothetical protein
MISNHLLLSVVVRFLLINIQKTMFKSAPLNFFLLLQIIQPPKIRMFAHKNPEFVKKMKPFSCFFSIISVCT